MRYVDNPFKSPAVLSLCPGIRGLERGVERVLGGAIRVSAYAEIEAFIIENLLAGMEAGMVVPAPIWSNLKTFPWESFRGRIHGFIGGYPCQPFSLAGERKGEDDPRHLWPFIRTGISTVRPVWCLFENVAGHLSMGFDSVYKDLREMGYLVEAGIYTAQEVGAPHRRERLFILAILENANVDRSWWNHLRWVQCEAIGASKLAKTRLFGSSIYEKQAARLKQQRQELGYSEMSECERIRNARPRRTGSSDYGEDELANSNSKRFRKERECKDGINIKSEFMADTYHQRLQGWISGILQKRRSKRPVRKSGSSGSDSELRVRPFIHNYRRNLSDEDLSFLQDDPEWNSDSWPARPGEEQFEWEEPRTVKPGLGCTVNGYNAREDLLRALGNSVVEQTAELAFIDLLQKHLNNL